MFKETRDLDVGICWRDFSALHNCTVETVGFQLWPWARSVHTYEPPQVPQTLHTCFLLAVFMLEDWGFDALESTFHGKSNRTWRISNPTFSLGETVLRSISKLLQSSPLAWAPVPPW